MCSGWLRVTLSVMYDVPQQMCVYDRTSDVYSSMCVCLPYSTHACTAVELTAQLEAGQGKAAV